VRAREGMIGLEGAGNTDGIVIDHVYIHDNDYSLQPSSENFWAEFSDSHNGGCTKWTEIKNSYLIQNNEKLVDDDCGVGDDCGCPRNLHDNRIVMDITSPRSSGRSLIVFFYFKSIDTYGPTSKPKTPRRASSGSTATSSGTSERRRSSIASGWGRAESARATTSFTSSTTRST
jgi:hypothetical protein